MNIITRKNILCQSPLSCQLGEVALEQQAPWGRPPFGTQLQLCVGMSRELSVEITFLLSNRAEKPVSRPPGPCCTLECAVPSRRVGSSRNRCMRPRPAAWTSSPLALGACNWSQPVKLCSRCREVVPMHGEALCGDRAEAVRARRAVVEAYLDRGRVQQRIMSAKHATIT